MSTLQQPHAARGLALRSPALDRLLEEGSALLNAFVHPSRLVDEVKRMRALQLQADRIEATDAALAATLRQRAARILS